MSQSIGLKQTLQLQTHRNHDSQRVCVKLVSGSEIHGCEYERTRCIKAHMEKMEKGDRMNRSSCAIHFNESVETT